MRPRQARVKCAEKCRTAEILRLNATHYSHKQNFWHVWRSGRVFTALEYGTGHRPNFERKQTFRPMGLDQQVVLNAGAFCFGAVAGWITRYTLAHTKEVSPSSLASVLSAIGGATITNIYAPKDGSGGAFAMYCIGLAVAFFLYVLIYDIDPLTGRIYRNWGIEKGVDGPGAPQAQPVPPPPPAPQAQLVPPPPPQPAPELA
jgi:hypothetical protein